MLAIDQIYSIKIGAYPWTDVYAKTNSILSGTLLIEDQARQLLDGCEIKITDPDPPQDQFHQGDKGLIIKWVRGNLVSGPLKNGKVVVAENWLQSSTTSSAASSCNCSTPTLMAKGCQCGGN